jgi:hypothetical protein
VLFFKSFKKFKGILGNREFRVGNTATKIISAVGKQCQPDGTQSKQSKSPVSQFCIHINHHRYNQQRVWNRFALHTTGCYTK